MTRPSILGNTSISPISASAERAELSLMTHIRHWHEGFPIPPCRRVNPQQTCQAMIHALKAPLAQPNWIPSPAIAALVPARAHSARMPQPRAPRVPHGPDRPVCGITLPISRPVSPKPFSCRTLTRSCLPDKVTFFLCTTRLECNSTNLKPFAKHRRFRILSAFQLSVFSFQLFPCGPRPPPASWWW